MVKRYLAGIGFLLLFIGCTPNLERGPVVFDRKLTINSGTLTKTNSCSSAAANCTTTLNLEAIYSFQKTQPGDVSEVLIFTHNFSACEIISVDFSPTSLTFTTAGTQTITVTAKVPCPCRAGNLDIVTRHRDSPPGSTTPHVSTLTSVPIPDCR